MKVSRTYTNNLLPTYLATGVSMSMSTSMIAAPSSADRSDMDVFEDAIESQGDKMDLEERVECHSANHSGVIPATPPLPPTQLQFSPLNANSVPMLDTSPSTSQRMVSL